MPLDPYFNRFPRITDSHRLVASFDVAVLSSIIDSSDDIGQILMLLRSGIYSNGGYFIRPNNFKIKIPIDVIPVLAESMGLIFPDRLFSVDDNLLNSMVIESFTGMSLIDNYTYQTIDILTDRFPSSITRPKPYDIGYADKRYFIGPESFNFSYKKLKRLVQSSPDLCTNVIFNNDGSIELKGNLKNILEERISFLHNLGCRQLISSCLFYDLLLPEERYYIDLVLKKGLYHNYINYKGLDKLLYDFNKNTINNSLLDYYINDVIGLYNNINTDSSYNITPNTKYIKHISNIDSRYLDQKNIIYRNLDLPCNLDNLDVDELIKLSNRLSIYNHNIK